MRAYFPANANKLAISIWRPGKYRCLLTPLVISSGYDKVAIVVIFAEAVTTTDLTTLRKAYKKPYQA